MKRNLMTVVAMLAAVFFLGATIAEAADVKFGGQLRPRTEFSEKNDFDDRTGVDISINTRIRLNVSADINDTTSAFIQMQAIGVYGTGRFTGVGAAPASDALADVGLHQAYFTLKNFFDLPVDLKFGRQEITLDGHRLIGSTGWTSGANTHDAIRLNHTSENLKVVYAFSKVTESTTTLALPDDDTDINAHILYGNFGHFKELLGGPLSLYFIAYDDDSNNTADVRAAGVLTNNDGIDVDDNIYTVGFRQAGHLEQLWGIDYRGEFYYQFGNAEGDAGTGAGAGTDRGAHMFGLRVGKKFNDVAWQPSATVWYDHLSGSDDGNRAAGGDWGTFNTLFDTGHKYYGFMDLFLSATGGTTAGLGLRDLAGKFSVKPPVDGLTLKADIHFLWTDVDLADNPATTAALGLTGTSAVDNHLGEELDLTAVYKYNSNTTIVAGYSHFFADDLFHAVNGASANAAGSANADDANWAYVMFNVVF